MFTVLRKRAEKRKIFQNDPYLALAKQFQSTVEGMPWQPQLPVVMT